MNLSDVPDGTVEVKERDLVHILACAMFYGARLPYGMVPPAVFRLLSREGESFLGHLRAEHESAQGFRTDQLLDARYDTPDQTGKVIDFEVIPEKP